MTHIPQRNSNRHKILQMIKWSFERNKIPVTSFVYCNLKNIFRFSNGTKREREKKIFHLCRKHFTGQINQAHIRPVIKRFRYLKP